ncbi:MAG: hypothetical protein J5851_09300 [Oscillospiraceae bacterium]|nr:hypothetical protein [Oscillospiraceae bacterium]
MELMSGEEMLMGMMELQRKWQESPYYPKEHDLPKGHWRRVVTPEGEALSVIITDHYVIGVKTARVVFIDRQTKEDLAPVKGMTNLRAGDVKADESEMAVVGMGRCFWVISLKTFEITKKVFFPKGFTSSDVYGTYSEDGTRFSVCVQKYDYDNGRYIFLRCEYETENYTLVSSEEVPFEETDRL